MKKFLNVKAGGFLNECIEQIYINNKNDEYVRFTKKNLNN